MDAIKQILPMLPFLLIISVVLTAVVSRFLLRLYKKATVKGMVKITGNDLSPPNKKEIVTTLSESELQIKTLTKDSLQNKHVKPFHARARKSIRTLMAIYSTAGIAYALIMTMALMVADTELVFSMTLFLWLLICYSWPAVLTITFLSVLDGRKLGRIIIINLAVLFTVASIVVIRNSEVRFWELALFWLYINALPSLLIIVALQKQIRAVGSMVLALIILAVGGALLTLVLVIDNQIVLWGIVELGSAFELRAKPLFVLILIFALFVFGFLGWNILKKLGVRYQEKRFSSQSFSIDILWLIFGMTQSIAVAFESMIWGLSAALAFLVYKLLVNFGVRWGARRLKTTSEAPRLLYLRVFNLGRRSEQFFYWLSKWWRWIGSVSIISGPDLMTSSVELHEFLDFMGGRLSRQFVNDISDLERRISSMDLAPDPDGRFRVNEFFCRTNNWKITMRKLSRRSDVVLMDLRSFSSSNHGCIYELEQLLDIVPLKKVIFLIDETTNLIFLEETLKGLWKGVQKDSPNHLTNKPTASLFHLKKSWHPANFLLSTLLAKSGT